MIHPLWIRRPVPYVGHTSISHAIPSTSLYRPSHRLSRRPSQRPSIAYPICPALPVPHINRTRLVPTRQLNQLIPSPKEPTRHSLIIVLALLILIQMRTRRLHLLLGPLCSTFRTAVDLLLVEGGGVAFTEILYCSVDCKGVWAGTHALAGDGDAGCSVVRGPGVLDDAGVLVKICVMRRRRS